METLTALNQIFARVLGKENIVLTSATAARDIPEWDSLAHLQLIAAVQKQFQIKFTLQEMQAIKGVPDFLALIAQKSAMRQSAGAP
jgi:acyl carrier protein